MMRTDTMKRLRELQEDLRHNPHCRPEILERVLMHLIKELLLDEEAERNGVPDVDQDDAQ